MGETGRDCEGAIRRTKGEEVKETSIKGGGGRGEKRGLSR